MNKSGAIFYPSIVIKDDKNKKKLCGLSIKPTCDHKAIILVEIYQPNKKQNVVDLLNKMKYDMPEIGFSFIDIKELIEQTKLDKNNEICEVQDMLTKDFVPMNINSFKY